MRFEWSTGALVALFMIATPAQGAIEPRIDRLVLCRDSWLEWKNSNHAALESFGILLHSTIVRNGEDPFFLPKSPMSIDGLTITQVYPESVGMGLGFSVVVDAPFDVAKRALEQDLGKVLQHCEASDGMRNCELAVAEQRTIILAANDPPNDKTTLIGCYYYYEK